MKCSVPALPCSNKLWPVIIWHQIWSCPLLAIRIRAFASEEAVLRLFENGEPGRGFRVLEPLVVDMICPRASEKVLQCAIVRRKLVFGQNVVRDDSSLA